ncbi:uncharacterized protein KY384_000991 [Bacidia gigantensis]|uniref:uncharacterized protein n=1 Tax=Bacidia gigantensis TaxID=2732470 RepID=UPI001D036773|nr:uncharacterized protein KY384_000991 [Bacidia gigantensis]KAG8534147.1 hypothetical protein KY384_000991 [Bacidia gigantensis]
MEHPSKRRRIERRAARPSEHLLSTDSNKHIRGPHTISHRPRFHAPDLILPPSNVDSAKAEDGDGDGEVPHKPLAVVKPKPTRLELRQLVTPPVTNAIDNNADSGKQTLNNVAQPVQGQDGQPTVNNVAQPIQNQVVQPAAGSVVTPATNVAGDVAQQAANTLPPTNGNVQTPAAGASVQTQPVGANAQVPPVGTSNDASPPAQLPVTSATAQQPNVPPASQVVPEVSKPVDDVPGQVSPLPANAAEAARKQALAEQEAKAKEENPNVPGSGGPAPPPEASISAQKGTNTASPLTGNRPPVPGPGLSSQTPLSEPSTPLPQSPSSTSSLASYFPSSQQTMNAPSTSPAATGSPSSSSNNLSPLANSNSTMSASTSPSATTSSSASASLLSAMSASSASIASMNATSTFNSLSSISSTTLSSGTLLSSFVTSPTPTTFATSTSAFQSSGQDSQTPSASSGASSTDVGGLVAGGSPTQGAAPGATTSAGSGAGSGSGTPPTKVLVGGIVGGCAGLILILVAILFLLRWRKGQVGRRRSISPPVPQLAGAGSAALGGGMTQRSSTRSNVPIAAAAILNRLRPASSQTATTTSTGPSEKGFQKISGRKLPSVLHSGGDGYGEASAGQAGSSAPPARSIAPGQSPFAGLAPALRPPSPQRSLSGSSFYRDSRGFYGGVVPAESASEDRTDPSSSPTSSSPTFPVPPSSGVPFAGAGHPPGTSSPGVLNIRPGPARQPVIQQGGIVPMRTPSRPQPSGQRPAPSPIAEHPRDAIGRSHPDQDGSRQSRFRESTTPP